MRKTLQKIGAVACALCITVFSGCNTVSEPSGDANVWSAYGTEKILYENDYSARYGEKTLKISAFKNEYESAQIVISSECNAKYTIQKGELKTADGEVLPDTAISIFHEKLVYVEIIKDTGVNTPPGYYPDALLPYETAVEYGENTVDANRNRTVWVQVYVDSNQKAGVYTGNFTVSVGKKTYDVPVSVTIYDYALSDTTYMKSLFCLNYDWLAYAELDSTKEMADTYFDFFLKYRLNPSDFPCALNSGYSAYANNEKFLDDVVKAAKDPRCSTYRIPTIGDTGVINYVNEHGEDTTLSVAQIAYSPYKQFIQDIAKRSVTEGINLFEKAYTYMTICDEYDDVGKPNGWVYAKYNHNRLKSFNQEHAQWVLDNLENTNPNLSAEQFEQLKIEISNGIKGIKNILTGISINPILNSPYPGEDVDVVFCPTIEAYSNQNARDELDAYAQTAFGETWGYTCVNPKSPYPTYHTEDDLISARMLNWMMYEYNISGNLYWSTAGYYNFGSSQNFQIQDYYQAPLRYPNQNGDGYLLYPGRQYGIYGPVSSIRLEAIRDGNEDYDLLYSLEDYYRNYGLSASGFDTVLKYMTSSLYNGTKCNLVEEDNVNFASSRKLLSDLLIMASKTGSVIESINIDKNNVTVKVVTPNGVTVAVDGGVLTTSAFGENILHTATFNLADRQTLNLNVTADGNSYGVSINLGKPATFVESSQLAGKISAYKSSSTVESKVEVIGNENVQTVSVKDKNGKPAFAIDFSSFNVGKDQSNVILNVYNAGSDINYSIVGICQYLSGYISLESGTLHNGWNEIKVSLSSLNCLQNGNVVDFRISLSNIDGTLLKDLLSISFGQTVLEG